MKAGIYKTPNGNLIYVAKDRTIKATSLSPSSWPGTKVSHRSKDDTVAFEGYRCTRHADVPNGCTDHQALVDSMYMAASLQPGERVADYGTKVARVEEIDSTGNDAYEQAAARAVRETSKALRHAGNAAEGAAEAVRRFVVPSALSAPYTDAEMAAWRKKLTASLLDQGFRLCHKASARKHRKQGHTVLPIGDGRFAWRAVTDGLYPYQRKTLAQLERYLGVAEA